MTRPKADRELIAEYDLPQVPCDVAPRVNTDYPTIRALHAGWVRQYLPPHHPGTVQRGIRQLDSLYDSLLFPVGIAERIAQHSFLLTAVVDCDDLAILRPAFFGQIVAADTDDPYTKVFAQSWKTIRENAPSEAVYQRIRERWQEWQDALVEETETRKSGQEPDLETVIRLHENNGGIRPYSAVAEYVLDIDAGEVAIDPDAVRAREAGITHSILVNDLYSYRKEYLQGGLSFNSVAVLCRDGYGLQEAIDTIYERISECNRILSDTNQILHTRYADHPLGERMHTYIDNYYAIAAGNLQWHLETPRYNGRGYHWDGRRARHVTLDSELAPLDPL